MGWYGVKERNAEDQMVMGFAWMEMDVVNVYLVGVKDARGDYIKGQL